MAVINTFKTINNIQGKINRRYSVSLENLDDIFKQSNSKYDSLMNAFYFGYAQGRKAAKAEMKKGVE